MRHLRLIGYFFRLSLMQEMEHRVDFLIWSVVDAGWTVIDLVFMSVLVSNVSAIGEWNYGQAIVVVGVFRLFVVFVWGWMYHSFKLIPSMISEGKLDQVLTKPIDSQFLVSFRQFGLSLIPSIVGGMTFIVYGMGKIGQGWDWRNLLIFVWVGAVAVILMYGIYFGSVAIALYVERLKNIHFVFTHLYDASRFPKEIYQPVLQRIFTMIIPIALMIVVPAETIWGGVDWKLVAWLHVMAIVSLAASRLIWVRGLKRYSSASN